MFSPLQDALKKLREVRQSDPSQPKRQAIAVAPPDPLENSSVGTSGVDIGGLDFDLGDADVFDDLLADDMCTVNEVSSSTQPQPPPVKPAATTASTPKSVSRLAAFTFSKPAQRDAVPQKQQQQPINSSQKPDSPQQLVCSQQPSRSQMPNKPQISNIPQQESRSQVSSEYQVSNSDTPPQQNSFATPRPGSSGSKAPGQVADFVTIVVNSSKRRVSSTGHQLQEVPGPLGLIDAPAPCVLVPTHKPVSAFKTLILRKAKSEQSGDVDFENGTWTAMLDHLAMPSYRPLTARDVIRTEERASWPICRVLELTRTQKVPSMLVQLLEISNSELDASAVVVDPTGEMRASIHHAVMRRLAFPLVASTSIILSNVAAMKLPGWPPFLVITGSMIEQIFATQSAGTREDPIVVMDTQKASVLTPTSAPQTTTDDDPVKPGDMPAVPNNDLPADEPTQPVVVGLDANQFDDMPEAADDMFGFFNNESFFGDDDGETDQL